MLEIGLLNFEKVLGKNVISTSGQRKKEIVLAHTQNTDNFFIIKV
jgi:hypothetical protein